MGEAERALPYLEESVRLHDDVGEPRDKTGALCRLAKCLIQLGRTSEAVEIARRGLYSAERVPDSPILVANASNAVGLATAAAGDLLAAVAHHTRALELQVGMGNHRDAAWTLEEMAECHLARGKAAEALTALEQCRGHLDQVGRRVLSEEGRSSFIAQ
jgi:tetratricopeptide (TPR) repeat protein